MRAFALVTLITLLSLVACSGGDDSAGAGPGGTDGSADGADGSADGADGSADGADGSADGADGGDGGTTYTAGDAAVTVPDGAAPEGVEPSIAVDDPGVPTHGYRVEGDIYALTPHGTEFSSPVTVALPIPDGAPEDLLVLKLDGPSDTTWEEIEWASEGGSAVFEVDSFSYYGLASGAGAPDNDGDGFDATTDCDDNDATTNPGATEVCDEKDNDCDGVVDEGVTTDYCADADGDGTGDPSNALAACSQPGGYVADCTDCNDADASVVGGCR